MTTRFCLFDLYGTLLDLESAIDRVGSVLAQPAAFLHAWRAKQLEYTWTRTLMGRYVDFQVLTEAALDWCLADAGVADPRVRGALLSCYVRLEAYRDAAPTLRALRDGGLGCGVLTNGTETMAVAALGRAGLTTLIDTVISVDRIGTFKPHPAVYANAVAHVGRAPHEVAFVSSNAWDAAGAVSAGLTVSWINRHGRPDEYDLQRTATMLRRLDALPAALIG